MITIASNDALLSGFSNGELIAYPTEAVYGLGCDPHNQQAVEKLLEIKQRPWQKGMILVADHFSQVEKYINKNKISSERLEYILSLWPGPLTWLMPKTDQVPMWISGESDMVAIRLSAHPDVKRLSVLVNSPLVSTSANKSGDQPIKKATDIMRTFSDESILIAPGNVGDHANPSEIRHAISGDVIRAS